MTTKIGVAGYLIVPETYEDNARTDAIEKGIAATLPPIDGLDASMPTAERCAVLAAAAAVSRSAFVARFGSAFDCELTGPVAGEKKDTTRTWYQLPRSAYAAA